MSFACHNIFCICTLLTVFQELECLQDHLEDLVSACRDVVGNLTELESEVRHEQHDKLQFINFITPFTEKNLSLLMFFSQDIQIDALLIRACEPVIQAHCHVRIYRQTLFYVVFC